MRKSEILKISKLAEQIVVYCEHYLRINGYVEEIEEAHGISWADLTASEMKYYHSLREDLQLTYTKIILSLTVMRSFTKFINEKEKS